MTKFHEGEEVEVQYYDGEGGPRDIIWRKAKIRHRCCDHSYAGEWWYIQFPDGTFAVCDEAHIREVSP